MKAILYVLKPLVFRVCSHSVSSRAPTEELLTRSCAHVDGGMHRPGVVLSECPWEVLVAKLGAGLIDTNELELGRPLDCWGRCIERRGCHSGASGGEAEEHGKNSHGCVKSLC